MADAKHVVRIDLNTDEVARKARIIAKHLIALADELERPSAVLTFDEDLTAEQAAKIREDMAAGSLRDKR